MSVGKAASKDASKGVSKGASLADPAAAPDWRPQMPPCEARLLYAIGAFKVLLAVALFFVGLGIIELGKGASPSRLNALLHDLHLSPVARSVDDYVRQLLSMRPAARAAVDVVAFAYASLYLIEGAGLLLRRRWAEWMTVVTTVMWLPPEAYEMWRTPGVVVVGFFVLNLVVLVFLLRRLHRTGRLVPPPSDADACVSSPPARTS